jgi:signal transduction histidine kinase/CHASE1-domain containing sensor protein/ActR/RegA family two-component response regulator
MDEKPADTTALTTQQPATLLSRVRPRRLPAIPPRTLAFGLLSVLVGLGATVAASLGAAQVVHKEASTRFDQLNERLSDEIERRVNKTQYGLYGVRALFIASKVVEREEFALHVAAHDIKREFPGAIGFGFIERFPRTQLDAFVARERDSGVPDFKVYGIAPEDSPLANMPDLFVIRYCFPKERNASAWGLDVGSESERRFAAERAVATGKAAISGRITLVQDGKQQTAFLFYLPVYRTGTDTSTPELRERNLLGLAYAPIILPEAIAGTTEALESSIAFDIFDGIKTTTDSLLSDADGSLDNHTGLVTDDFYAKSMFVARTPLSIGGRTWTLIARSTPQFEASINHSTPVLIAIGGSLLSLLGTGLLLSFMTSRQRALTLAEGMTADLALAHIIAEEAQAVAQMGNWSYNLSTGEVTWSKQLYKLFERDEALGPPNFEQVLSDYDETSAARLTEAVTQAAKDATPYSIILRTNKNISKHVRGEGRARLDARGKVVELFGTATDVTNEIENAESLRRAQEQAESASRAKSAFLANMSHEIRTPLTAILGFTDLLRDTSGSATEQQRLDAIATIHNAGNHLLTIINDILDLSKVEAEKMTLETIETPVGEILREVETLLKPRAHGKGIAYTTALEGPIPDRIMSDPTRFRQILMNLTGNAVKFTECGGVTVSASQAHAATGPRLHIEVRDTGSGIAPEQSQSLFEPFEQANETVTRRHGGTGLGLAICSRLATLMGGSVTLVRTAPGEGSAFRLDLPLTPAPNSTTISRLEDAANPSTQAASSAPSTSLQGRILLAEDGVDNQRLIAFHLRKAGATVDIADNGRIALDRLTQADPPYDLLITDMQMPEMDGYTLASELRARGDDIPIIALTAHAMPEDRRKCEQAGCDDYATKPIDKEVLVDTAARWLRASRQRHTRPAAA